MRAKLTGSSAKIVNIKTHNYPREITYSRFPWYTSRNDDDISASQSLLQAVIRGQVSLNFGRGGDMRKVGSDTGGVDNIEKPKLHHS